MRRRTENSACTDSHAVAASALEMLLQLLLLLLLLVVVQMPPVMAMVDSGGEVVCGPIHTPTPDPQQPELYRQSYRHAWPPRRQRTS